MNVTYIFDDQLDFGTQFGLCVSIERDGKVIRHAVRGDSPLTAEKLANSMRMLADWIEDCYEDRYKTFYPDAAFAAELGLCKRYTGSGTGESIPEEQSVSSDKADDRPVQGLGSGSHDSLMRWWPGRS